LVTRLAEEQASVRGLRAVQRLLAQAEAQADSAPLREARQAVEGLVRAATRDGGTSLVLADELYDQATRARMVPAETLFGRMQRAVRDAGQETGKDVRLVISGADTVLDKRLLDDLHDPLLHLVRNAVDHGIEPSSERAACGKPPQGTIRLSALPSGDHAIVEIEDDGAGLVPDLFRATAVRRGLLSDAEAAGLSDEAAINLMFRPGFSTRDTTSALSGRGVGMDVVKTSLEAAKGHVVVQSRPGKGTRFELTLPLSVATLRVLLVHAAQQTFAVPTSAVEQCSWLGSGAFDDGRSAVLDGARMPLRVLSGLLGPGSPRPGPCVVLRDGQERVALLVEAIHGETAIVVEPLGRLLRGVRSVTGGALQRNGQVALVLSVPYLFWEAGSSAP
jgi:two-component system chemotaxis sensor kinase CheA